MVGSSSTISALGESILFIDRFYIRGKNHDNGRAMTRRAFHLELPFVTFHDPIGDGESQSGSGFFCCEKRLEKLVLDFDRVFPDRCPKFAALRVLNWYQE